MSQLFSPLKLGRYTLTNAIAMAPMTRSRATAEGVPTDLMAEYYAQRASAGLIITEGTAPSALGKGYMNIPGLYNAEQVAGWRKVTESVHAQGGKIFVQIMHTGRVAHTSLLPNEAQPLAPSAITLSGQTFTPNGLQPYSEPRAMTEADIEQVLSEYENATRLALEAGFDGVELHAASGYLPEQFLTTGSNQRTDNYGGSVENRARFLLQALERMIKVAGAERVGIKLSPEMPFNDIRDANPQETYPYVVQQIAHLGLAYLHVALFGTTTDYHALFRPLFKSTYLYGGGLTKERAEQLLAEQKADGVVFGTLFIANPDLPERLRQNAPFNEADKSTFYGGGAKGYTDYPTLAA
ncbi:MAG: alkene reductase [Thiofilum sp.]|uniref:alkene reductase n=1 Tax=Thiofilum sp. TaxID=2212733 RepID=UPI0025FA3865|nr:alkene reductase [Thiofilum sp.]MBK8454883.1 alkene reductase [Thiofilum sp.]